MRLPHWPKDSDKGALDVLPSAFIFWKAGLSFMLRRIQTLTPSKARDTRKGMRQAHSPKASSPKKVRVPRMTSSDRNKPIVAVVWIQAV